MLFGVCSWCIPNRVPLQYMGMVKERGLAWYFPGCKLSLEGIIVHGQTLKSMGLHSMEYTIVYKNSQP